MSAEDSRVRVVRDERGICFRTEDGRFDIEATALRLGRDLTVAIRGGQAHVGAVALAQPRPSLRDPRSTSATASVLCVVGHKEDAVVKRASEFLAAALDARVVVTAGIHWDDLGAEGIRAVMAKVDLLVQFMARHLAGESE